jgi:hypothetical protein
MLSFRRLFGRPSDPPPARRSAWRVASALALTLTVGGCVPVKPYQREHLSERCMAAGFGDLLELQFRGHWEGSRHGSEGGFTTAGGGCGCN